MWNNKLCLRVSPRFNTDETEQIRMVKEAGFDGIFFVWEKGKNLDELVLEARKNNLFVQSVHAPFGGSADMWGDDEDEGKKALDELLKCLHLTKRNNVPIMVVHAFIGFDKHDPTEKGVERYSVLVDEAERLGVKIAFENTEGEEYLARLMDAFKDRKNVGFCWDTGHEMCYNRSKDMLSLYGDRLICTHINDNLGIKDYDGKITFVDDLHLLPFDGIADWENIAERLVRENYTDSLTFELSNISKPGRHENDVYGKMDFTDYLALAFCRACRVASLVEKARKKQEII